LGVMTDQGDGREDGYKKQEGQRHKNKPANFDCARKDGRLDSGSKALHHDTWAATGESAGNCAGIADGRSLRIIQQSVEDRILATNFVLS
jgi:hypothetical protein